MLGARGSQRPAWVLATALALLGVLPLAALAVLVQGRATEAVQAEARAGLSGTTSLTSQFLEEQLVGVQNVVNSYAKRPFLLRALQRAGGPDTRELKRQMTELRGSRTDVLSVAAVADAKGTMLASTVASPPGTDYRRYGWHSGALRTRAPFVFPAFVGFFPGSPLALAVSAPVVDANGRGRAVVVVGYRLTVLHDFVKRFAAEQDIDITVTDQRGVLIARPGSAPTTLEDRRSDPRVASALAGRTGVDETRRGASGHTVLSAYSPVPRLGWSVVAELPRDRAYAEVTRLRRDVLAISAPLALLLTVGAVLLARSLRSRDRARDRAQELASINSAVLEAAFEGLTLVDPQGRPLLRNATSHHVGRDLAEHPDSDVYQEMEHLAPEMADPAAFRAAAAAMATDPDLEVSDDFTHVASNRSFHRYSRPVRSKDGGLVGRLFVLRETTAERAAEAAIRQAKQEAELANSAKTDFLSRMSHELRTPLHAILGFGELLGREDLTTSQRECLDQMTRGGRHLLHLINEVLDLQRVERGELSLSVEPVELAEVVEEVLALTATLADARGTRAHSVGVTGNTYLVADRQRLKQVLLNLVSNAVKYGRAAGEVTVTARPTDQGAVRVAVHDDGPGIPAENLPLLFQRFERLGADQSDVEGSGLGLALSKQLVTAMGGEIGVESTPGQGTTFWFALPASAPPAARPGPAVLRDGGALRTGPPAQRVLLVEDNPANTALVRTVLTKRPQVELLVAGHGAEGLELASRHRPDLVLLDLNLPDMDGAEVLRRLREALGPKAPAVVVLSADATPRQVARLLAQGADGYLTKPFAITDFLSVIDGGPSDDPSDPDVQDDEQGALDLATVRTIRGLSAGPSGETSALVADLLSTYFSDTPGRLQQLRQALEAGDLDAVRAQAHSLRGGSAGIGARLVAELSQDLETAAAAGDRSAAAHALDALDAAVPATRTALARAYGVAPGPVDDDSGAP